MENYFLPDGTDIGPTGRNHPGQEMRVTGEDRWKKADMGLDRRIRPEQMVPMEETALKEF